MSSWFLPPTTNVEYDPDLEELLKSPSIQWALRKIYGDKEPAKLLRAIARECGVPDDALKRFLAANYVPQPKQLEFHGAARLCDHDGGPVRIGIGGARGGAKSHAMLGQMVIDDCQRMRGLKFLFLRKVLKAARESFDDLRRKVLMGVEHDYSRTEGILSIPKNDSRVILGHFKNENDIDGYLGIEYDGVAIEEGTQLSENKVRDISSCVRTSKPGWRPREYYTTNPGGVGHEWFKREFIEPARKKKETDSRFIFASSKDNAFLNQEYQANLERLTGWKKQAWRDGDWDIAAGQFFTTWNYDAHVIKPFVVPSHWPAWACMDYGRNHPTVVYLLRENDGIIYVTAEHYLAQKLPVQHSPLIKGIFLRHGLDTHRVRPFVAGADVFAKRDDEQGKTIADQYAQYGIILERADMDRINRAGEVLMLLGDVRAEQPIEPRIQIFNTCVRLIECLPTLQHDPKRPEDVLKVDVDEDGNGGDDPYDSLGYGVMVKRRAPARPAVAGRLQTGTFRMT